MSSSNLALPRYSFSQMFRPLPLPVDFVNVAYKMRPWRQAAIALALNILSLALPIMMLQVYDRIIPHQSYGSLAVLTLGVATALVFDVILRLIRSYLVSWSAASNEHVASCAAIDVFIRSDMAEFEKISSGEHLQNLTALNRLREFYSGQAWTALIDLPYAAIFLALIFYLGGVLVAVPIMLLLAFFVNAALSGRVLREALENRSRSDDLKASFVVSVLKGIHTVKSLSYESFLLRKFEATQTDVSHNSYRVAEASGFAAIMSAAFGQLSLILTATAGFFLVLNGDLSVGGLSACTLLAGRSIQPVQRVLATWLRLQDLTVAQEQAESIFKIPSVLRNKTKPQLIQGRILLDNISYGQVLNSVSLQIMPGEIVALAGDNAAGKSALLQMICGMLKPDQGEVRLDDVNPNEYSMSDLQDLIGYLPQDGAIFKGTIIENMTGFRNDDINIFDQALEAGRELGLDAIIDLLPRGYQTPLTDSAADPVPPGVKQRIALSRILTNRPSILLFDNADRALDKEGYNLLFKLMGRYKGKSTIVLVTQDQNLLSFADRSLHLENGTLIEGQTSGTQNIAIFSQARNPHES